MLDQLYDRRLAQAGFVAWTAGLVLGALAPLTTAEWVPLGAALTLSLGAAATVANGLRVGWHWLGLAKGPEDRPDNGGQSHQRGRASA
jgi:hypothetical protein